MKWEAWLVRDGLTLICYLGLTFELYLDNFRRLKAIYLLVITRIITLGILYTLRTKCYMFVLEFELLYYRGEDAKLSICKLNGYSLFHLGTCKLVRLGNTNFFS